MSSDLLACPFCGGQAVRIDVPDDDEENAGGSCIQCEQCAASSALYFDRKENMTSDWNRRTYLRRQALAFNLAALDGVDLLDIHSTVGPANDANNWREYLGRADDLLALISVGMGK